MAGCLWGGVWFSVGWLLWYFAAFLTSEFEFEFALIFYLFCVFLVFLFLFSRNRRILEQWQEDIPQLQPYLPESTFIYSFLGIIMSVIALIALNTLTIAAFSFTAVNSFLLVLLLVAGADILWQFLLTQVQNFITLRDTPEASRTSMMTPYERYLLLPMARGLQLVIRWFFYPLSWLLMLIARGRRILFSDEGRVIVCQQEGCQHYFENPNLICGDCGCSDVTTWPVFNHPLFSSCPSCHALFPTWKPVATLLLQQDVKFQYNFCQFKQTNRCVNLGLSVVHTVHYQILLIATEPEALIAALRQLYAWCGKTYVQSQAQEKNPLILDFPQQQTRLSLYSYDPLQSKAWGGGYDWVVFIPALQTTQEQRMTEVAFGLERLEFPMSRPDGSLRHALPSLFRRLFGSASAEEKQSAHALVPKMAVWQQHPIDKAYLYPRFDWQIIPIETRHEFQQFLQQVTG